MKGLQFLGNRVEDAANAFIDVLKYSDQSVDYPDFKDIEPWPDEIVDMFKDALKDKPFSEISAILMYTQQSSRFDLIAELMLGIGLVEMRHYDKLSDFLQKADPHEQDSVMDIYPKVEIGFSPQSALKIAWNSEIETIGNYKKIMNNLALYSERADYDDVMYLLNKLIADEEHHIKLIKEAMGVDKGTKGVTVNMSQVAIIHKESRDNYISGNSYTWCPCCGKCYILSEEEVVNAIDNDLSVYAECSCGNSFYIETEDEQDNYSEW